MLYKSYIIETSESGGQWLAHIRRPDGKPISTEPHGSSNIPVLTTKTYFKEIDAIDEAKRMIDGGGMK